MATRDLKSWVRRLLLLTNVAVAVGTACFALIVFLAPDWMSTPGSGEAGVFRVDVRGSDSAWIVALLAAGLLVADFLWIVYGGPSGVPTTHVLSETADGPVRVARDALESGLRAAGEALDEVSRLRVAIDTAGPLGKRVILRSWFHAPDGVPIEVASQRLRAALRRRFGELVKLPDGGRLDVEIEFAGFQGRLARKPEEPAAPPAPVADEPFTGPQYPIDGE